MNNPHAFAGHVCTVLPIHTFVPQPEHDRPPLGRGTSSGQQTSSTFTSKCSEEEEKSSASASQVVHGSCAPLISTETTQFSVTTRGPSATRTRRPGARATHLLHAEGVSVVRVRARLVLLIDLARRLEGRVLEVVGALYAVAVLAEDRPDGGAVVFAVQGTEATSVHHRGSSNNKRGGQDTSKRNVTASEIVARVVDHSREMGRLFRLVIGRAVDDHGRNKTSAHNGTIA